MSGAREAVAAPTAKAAPTAATTLRVGPADDAYEREADRAAEAVAGGGLAPWINALPDPGGVRRKCDGCAKVDEEGTLRREAATSDAGGWSAPPIVGEVLRGAGRPLDAGLRAEMERGFGHDFSGVRVHDDARAAESASAVSAHAYTVGSDVVFAAGRYAPASAAGRRLVAHELAHVVQGAADATRGGAVEASLPARPTGPIAARAAEDGRPTHRAPVRGLPVARLIPGVIHRFGSQEHQSLGDQATGSARYNIGSTSVGGDRFELSHGDIVALSGDYFLPDESADGLFRLAGIPGNRGQAAGTRDEIICALFQIRGGDPRFATGGTWAGFQFSPAVLTAVRERYQRLAAANATHFVAPRGRDASGAPITPPTTEGSAVTTYRTVHEAALRMAYQAGRAGVSVDRALAREAAAQHFLTDSFAAGHLRTEVGNIREYWRNLYPLFWFNLLNKLALDTAVRMNAQDNNVTTALGTVNMMYQAISGQVSTMAQTLPEISLGDLLSKLFHDRDNEQGLALPGGGRVFGDGHLDDPNPQNVTRARAQQAIVDANRDVTEAHRLGSAGAASAALNDAGLFAAVRTATGATGTRFVPETRVPIPDTSANSAQNWRAASFEQLWSRPMTGASGATVGDRIRQALASGEIRDELNELGQRFPVVESRFTGDLHPRRAYLDGFVAPLAARPREGILAVINWAPNYGLAGDSRDNVALQTGQQLDRAGRLGGMTTEQRARYVRELIDGYTGGDEGELVVHIFQTAPTSERRALYQRVEGHAWTGDFRHGVLVTDDDIWDALSRGQLTRLRAILNAP